MLGTVGDSGDLVQFWKKKQYLTVLSVRME